MNLWSYLLRRRKGYRCKIAFWNYPKHAMNNWGKPKNNGNFNFSLRCNYKTIIFKYNFNFIFESIIDRNLKFMQVSGLQAEGSSARSIVLTWTAYEHLFTDCILEFRVEVWPARRASSILSSKSTRTLTSWRHGCNDTSPTQDVECFDMQVCKIL